MRKKRPAYEPYEEWIIQALKRIFKEVAIKADDHHKVGKLPLEIDLVAVVENMKSLAKLPPLFRYFQRHNILEIKSEKTRFKVADLQKLQAYGWLYMMKPAVESPNQVTLTALVHQLPRAVRKALPKYGFEPARKGVFCRRSHPVSYVIVLKEVPDELLPEELQAFSTRERRLRIVLAALQKREKPPILEAMFNLYANEVDQLMMTREAMAQKLVKIAGPQENGCRTRQEISPGGFKPGRYNSCRIAQQAVIKNTWSEIEAGAKASIARRNQLELIRKSTEFCNGQRLLNSRQGRTHAQKAPGIRAARRMDHSNTQAFF